MTFLEIVFKTVWKHIQIAINEYIFKLHHHIIRRKNISPNVNQLNYRRPIFNYPKFIYVLSDTWLWLLTTNVCRERRRIWMKNIIHRIHFPLFSFHFDKNFHQLIKCDTFSIARNPSGLMRSFESSKLIFKTFSFLKCDFCTFC